MEGVIGERMIGSCALSVLLAKTTGAWGLINRLTGDEVRCRHRWSLLRRSTFECLHWLPRLQQHSTQMFEDMFSLYLSKLCLKPKPFMWKAKCRPVEMPSSRLSHHEVSRANLCRFDWLSYRTCICETASEREGVRVRLHNVTAWQVVEEL
jgi:hypothetical protein